MISNLNISYFAPLLLVIGANSIYHFTTKNTPAELNPFFGLMVTYSTALVLSIMLFIVTKSNSITFEITKIKWTNIILGFAVLGVESGWILMYMNGWEISKASIIANICVAIILFIAGIIIFKDAISIKKVIGLLVCIIGVFLLNSK